MKKILNKEFNIIEIFNDKEQLIYIVNPENYYIEDVKKEKAVNDKRIKRKIINFIENN